VVTMSYRNAPSMLAKESMWVNRLRGFTACIYRVDAELPGGEN
jgi:hypothetical protein